MEIFTSQKVSTVEDIKGIDKIGKMIKKERKQTTKLANLISIDAPETDDKSYDGNKKPTIYRYRHYQLNIKK